jgi:hypothetical protein
VTQLKKLTMFGLLWLAFGQQVHAESWIRGETPHFVVYSNIDAASTRSYLEQLESFKYLAELILGSDPKSDIASARFTIYLLDKQASLRTVRPTFNQNIGGVYLHCVEGALAFGYRPQSYDIGAPDYGLFILQHEYAHHLMFSRMRRFYPSWYVEGFADYLGETNMRRGTFVVGARSEQRTNQLVNGPPWIDFNVLLDPVQLIATAQRGELNGLQFYAQSWLLTHYMLADSARTQAFNTYFDHIGRGESAISSFESTTGIAVAQLPGKVRAHLRKLPGLRVTIPDLPEASAKLENLPRDQGDYLLEAAVLQTCPGEERGKELTQQLRGMRAKHVNDSRFRVELSRAELLFGDPQAGRSELESLAQSKDWAFDVAYLLGRSYFEEAQRNASQREALLDKAAEQFLKAYQIDKRHPATLYFLSRSLDTSAAPSKSVINAGTAAAVLAPSVADYALHAATISLRTGDRDTAIRVMQPFASDPHNLDYGARVSAFITEMKAGKDVPSLMTALMALQVPKAK